MPPPTDPSSDATSRHACHCGKSFVRKEHLTRHQATHAQQLAHICNVCQRQFSRKELLRRHSALHEPSHTRVIVSCDACRANKTKCSGGPQCSLCARRGINCTFRSGDRLLREQPPPTGHDESVTASASSVHEGGGGGDGDGDDDDDDDGETLPTSSKPDNLPAGNSLSPGRELLDHEWFRTMTIVASEPVETSDYQHLSPGMEAIYGLLLTEKSSLEGAIAASDGMEEWIAKCLEAYFKSFHLRWPVLNAPSFDATTASLPLSASVCVLGAWLRDDANRRERLCALQVHDLLLQRLLSNLINLDSMLDGNAWPIEHFQAILLTLIFSLYRSDKEAVSKAILLRGAFITLLREIGAFDTGVLSHHLQTHYSGSFAPYTMSMRERFMRLLSLTYQFDAYFALAYNKPPRIYREEVGADLTMTFALWNAHGLDIFAKRLPEEPAGRSGFQVCTMTNSPGSFSRSQLLVEDAQLGLCGVLQVIWEYRKLLLSKTKELHHNLPFFQSVLVIETLDAWKCELDKIGNLANTENITSNVAKYLRLAYRGQDDSVAATLERITTLVQDSVVLYYYLKMHHYTGIVELLRQTDDSGTDAWWTSGYGKEALVCALHMLETVDSIQATGASANPLTKHALAMGANIITRMLASCDRCECLTRGGGYGHGVEIDAQQWAIGEPLIFDGTPLCVCKSRFWTGKFEKAIQDQSIMVEDGELTTSSQSSIQA